MTHGRMLAVTPRLALLSGLKCGCLRFAEFAQTILDKHSVMGDFPWNTEGLVLLERMRGVEENEREYGQTVALTLNLLRLYINQLPDMPSADASSDHAASGERVMLINNTLVQERHSQIAGLQALTLSLRREIEHKLELLRQTDFRTFRELSEILRSVMNAEGSERRAALRIVEAYASKRSEKLSAVRTRSVSEFAVRGGAERGILRTMRSEREAARTGIRPNSLGLANKRLAEKLSAHAAMPTAKEMFRTSVERQQHEFYRSILESSVFHTARLDLEERIGRELLPQELQRVDYWVRSTDTAELILLMRSESARDYDILLRQITVDGERRAEATDMTHTENRLAIGVLHSVYERLTQSHKIPETVEPQSGTVSSAGFETIISGALRLAGAVAADVTATESFTEFKRTLLDIVTDRINHRESAETAAEILREHEETDEFKESSVSQGLLPQGIEERLLLFRQELMGESDTQVKGGAEMEDTPAERGLLADLSPHELELLANRAVKVFSALSAAQRGAEAESEAFLTRGSAEAEPGMLIREDAELREVLRYEPLRELIMMIQRQAAESHDGELISTNAALERRDAAAPKTMSASTDMTRTVSESAVAAAATLIEHVTHSIAESVTKRELERQRGTLMRVPVTVFEEIFRSGALAEVSELGELREAVLRHRESAEERVSLLAVERWGEISREKRSLVLTTIAETMEKIVGKDTQARPELYALERELLQVRSPFTATLPERVRTQTTQRVQTESAEMIKLYFARLYSKDDAAYSEADRETRRGAGPQGAWRGADEIIDAIHSAPMELAKEILFRAAESSTAEEFDLGTTIVYSQHRTDTEGWRDGIQTETADELWTKITEQERTLSLSRVQLEELKQKIEQQEQSTAEHAIAALGGHGVRTAEVISRGGISRNIMNELKEQMRIERLRHGTD